MATLEEPTVTLPWRLRGDTNSDESRLIIVDAQDFTAPPVATIHLPHRVPYGALGSWVPEGTVN